MEQLPVLLVLRAEPAEVVQHVLRQVGLESLVVTSREAADLVGQSEGDLVVCERAPGWQALILRVENAGGAALVLGPRPGSDEALHSLLHAIECVEDIDQLVGAITRARARRDERLVRANLDLPEEDDDLEQRLKISEQVARFAQSIASQLDLSNLVAETVARIRDLCDAELASVLLVDPATGELRLEGQRGQSGGPTPPPLPSQPGNPIALRVALKARSRLLGQVQTSDEFQPALDEVPGFETGSLLAVPLLHRGDVVGVLEARRSVRRPAFAASRLHRLEQLAPHVAIAVQNARVNAGLRSAQAEVRSANAELEDKVQFRTAQIARAKREWEATFDAIQEPLAVQDGYVLRRANVAYARRAGVSVTQLPGRTCHELLAGRSSPCPGCPLNRSAEEGLQAQLELPDGTVHAINTFQLEGDERLVVHYRDITGEKRLANELRESERLAAVGQLASGAAHEINNPMGFLASNLQQLHGSLQEMRSAIASLSELNQQLARGEVPARAATEGVETLGQFSEWVEDGVEIVAESLEGARRITAIVKGLRELARLEVSQITPTQVNASLSRILRRELGGDVQRTERLESRQPVLVAPLQLDQLFEHIARNARQALDSDRRVEIKTRDLEGFVEIEFRDHGAGIPQANLHRIFEPFFTTRGVGRGIGLGLTVAYGIVQRAGGRIEVTSREGEGTRVLILLPRAVGSAADASQDIQAA